MTNKPKLIAKLLLTLLVLSSIGVGDYLVYEFSKSNQQNIDYQTSERANNDFQQLKFTSRETQQALKLVKQNYCFDLINFQYLFLTKLKASYRELLDKTITFEIDNQETPQVINVKLLGGEQNELNWKYSII